MEEFTIFVFDTYYISVCVKFGDIFLTARERKILSMCQLSKKKVRNALNMRFRPVAGGEAEGARAPPEIFRFELNFATKVEFCLLKCTAVNGIYSFQVLSLIERLYTAIWNGVKKRNLSFALPKTANKISAYFSSKKQNGSKCTNDDP